MTCLDTPPPPVWNAAGNLAIGTSTDSLDGTAWYDLIDDRYTSHGLITGPPGSGRHTTAAVITAAARSHPAIPVHTCYLSPRAHATAPGLTAATRITGADLPLARPTLDGVLAARARAVHARGLPTLAGSDIPVLLIVLDHAEDLAARLGAHWLLTLAASTHTLNIALLAVLGEQPRHYHLTHRPLWKELARGNEIRMRPGQPGTADVRDIDTQEPITTHITDLPAISPHTTGHDAPLDEGTAAAFGRFHTPA